MPHVVFDRKLDLVKFQNHFHAIFQKEPVLIKIQNIFLDKFQRTMLLETNVIDKKNQHFLIEINSKEDKTTLRLYPNTDPEKTNGVKYAMGNVAKQLSEIFPDAKITQTNIQEFILSK
ncbi:MAG: hypothetical protein FJ356_03960 [Thaumarchaeota archaeon]|nr:hypothetical protein [Nitrososphaerota archaeon]